MLSNYLNQTAQLRRATGTDEYGQPIFGLASTILCRRQNRSRLVFSPHGSSRVNEITYYLTECLVEGDMLDGKVVGSVDVWIGLRGYAVGYKAVI